MRGPTPYKDESVLWKTGFGCVNAACRKRVETRIWQAARNAGARGWAIGFFNAERDLVAFETSGSGIEIRAALTLLCMVPVPESQGLVELKASTQSREGSAEALGIAIKVGEACSVVLAFIEPKIDADTRWETLETVQSGAVAAAEEISGFATEYEGRNEPLAVAGGPQAFFLLSSTLDVQIAWHGDDEVSKALAALAQPQAGRLPLFLERAVRRLTSSWNFAAPAACVSGVAYPVKGLSLRVVPMTWGGAVVAGVFLSSCEARHVDAVAASFGVSSRELQVLHKLFDGLSVADIANELGLAESTVNDHIARIVAKTNSRNRTEMTATLLGWPAMKAQNADGAAADESASEVAGNGKGRISWRYGVAAAPVAAD
jgi:DNA-binding CsgD family transcriptional regulator